MEELSQANALLNFVLAISKHSQVELIVSLMLPFVYWIFEQLFSMFVTADRTSMLYYVFQTAIPLYSSITSLLSNGDNKGWATYWTWFMSTVPFALPSSTWRYLGIFVNALLMYPDPHIPRQMLFSVIKSLTAMFPQLNAYIDPDFFKGDISLMERKRPNDMISKFVYSMMDYLLPKSVAPSAIPPPSGRALGQMKQHSRPSIAVTDVTH